MKTGCITRSIFFPRSFSCLRTESADFWSLKGKVINTGLSVGLIQLWFWSWEAWNLLKMESISCLVIFWLHNEESYCHTTSSREVTLLKTQPHLEQNSGLLSERESFYVSWTQNWRFSKWQPMFTTVESIMFNCVGNHESNLQNNIFCSKLRFKV